MAWLPDAAGRPPRSYRAIRRLARGICDTWFREHALVDHEWIPEEGGVLFAAWHPGSMIDPLFMFSSLPGQLTFAAKHTLFNYPILGRVMHSIGAKPIYRAIDKGEEGAQPERGAANEGLLDTLAGILVEQGRCAIYPEGVAHLGSRPERIKTGPARIMLRAIRRSREAGVSEPALVPVGIHYTDQNKFRERALLQIHPPMQLPPLPAEDGAPKPSQELLAEFEAAEAADRAWVQAVTVLLAVEMERSSQGLDNWDDRKLLWRTRSLVWVHRARAEGRKGAPTYAEAVLGARRTRAAWLHMIEEQPEQAEGLRDDVAAHSERMQEYGLKEFELYERDSRPGYAELAKAAVLLVWSTVWIIGMMAWGAMIGSYPPYNLAGKLAKPYEEKMAYVVGTYKIAIAFLLLPLWWLLISLPIAWLITTPSSPVWSIPSYGVLPFIQPYLLEVPLLLMAVLLLFGWPLSARLHLVLWRRVVLSWRTWRRWFRLRDGSIPWKELQVGQRDLAVRLVDIGRSLVLPGDPDWKPPPTGVDDHEMVRRRTAS